MNKKYNRVVYVALKKAMPVGTTLSAATALLSPQKSGL